MNRWHDDIHEMHKKYGVHEWMEKNKDNKELMQKFLHFRLQFLLEEWEETNMAMANGDPAEVVDGLIDLCVIAIGTLDAFDVDAQKAWEQVHNANMKKEVGIKESRPNPLGLPDLIKPEGWVGPTHHDNNGNIRNAL